LFKEDYDDWDKIFLQIDNKISKNIINSFDTYNFIIDEDSFGDQTIAVNPEFLSNIFQKTMSVNKDNIDEILKDYEKNKKKNIANTNSDNIVNIDI
jgi:hypothetical protein